MYRPTGNFSGASAQYRNIELNTRIQGASPHKLIAILFEDLLKALDACKAALALGDIGKIADRQSRALSILQALDTSLDFEKGGEIATALSSIYREGRRLVRLGVREKCPEHIEQARAMLGEIASAWEVIG